MTCVSVCDNNGTRVNRSIGQESKCLSFRRWQKSAIFRKDRDGVSPVNGTMVAVFLHNGEYFAINDFCPHMGASLSDSPVAENGSVMCSWHAWCFSIKDGLWLDNSKSGIKTPTYPVRLEGKEIQVSVPLPEPRKASDDATADTSGDGREGDSA